MESITNFEYGRTLAPQHRETFINDKFNEFAISTQYPFANLSIWLNGTYVKPVSARDIACNDAVGFLQKHIEMNKRHIQMALDGKCLYRDVVIYVEENVALDRVITRLKKQEEI